MAENTDDEIHTTDDSPILTTYEPNFHRSFARGSLLRVDEDDEDTLQVGFWSSKDEDIMLDDGDSKATGYRLETEVMMNWDTALRLRNRLNDYIEDHAPERYLSEDS